MDLNFSKIVQLACDKYTQPDGKVAKYGTAGFRLKADGMDYIMYRMGVLAALRSSHKNAAIGLMITASHNPVCDNGIKMVDPAGEMLAADWEEHATFIVNQKDSDLDVAVKSIISRAGVDVTNKPVVIIGQDTRPTSQTLCEAAKQGAEALGAKIVDLGVVSTPILHFVVTCTNDGGVYGKPNASGYYDKISSAFTNLQGSLKSYGNYTQDLFFDGANGVGALAMADMAPNFKGYLEIIQCNSGEGILNHMCGADYVKTNQKWPEGVPRVKNRRCVSVDGDADRVIYSYIDKNDKFHLVDGDKIACLVAGFIKRLLKESGLDLKMGLVQTAYANGASTEYIKNTLGVPVVCTKTGVKYLHHAALEFDVGVYFEANGHGTVVFTPEARTKIRKSVFGGNTAACTLSRVLDIINETVGDAISDMLLVETVLYVEGWSIEDWNNFYTDYPNKLSKVQVKDRSIIKTFDAERKCESPAGLQDEIDKQVAKYKQARAFVRPSGTENVVRVYAEGATSEDVEQLTTDVIRAVFDFAGGIGDRP